MGKIKNIQNGLNDINFKKEFMDILKSVRDKPINKVKTYDENLPIFLLLH